MMGFAATPGWRLQKRLVGVFLVTGLPCGARAYPVSDGAKTVAAFIVLDADILADDPSRWRLCGRTIAAPDRAAALRDLILATFSEVAGAE